MSVGNLSKERLGRMHDIMAGYVERGELSGMVTLVSRRGEVHADAIGKKSFDSSEQMRRDTIFRIASMTKPITAAAAMILVEECRLRLDEPIDRLLPELADRNVLMQLDGPLDDTVPAKRPITLRDLLTFRLGIGAVMALPGRYPIQKAMDEAGLAPGPNPPECSPDEWMKRLGSLPLIHQPGESFMYHTGSDILGVLIARAADRPLEQFLRERIFEPLGMKDTGFHVPADKLDRLSTSYRINQETGAVNVHDEPLVSRWSSPPVFPSGGGGLVSTADDYLAFCQMMLNKGRHGGERILSRPSIELMTTDHLTAEQKASARIFFGDHSGWGFGVAINLQRNELYDSPGRFGWNGGMGTSGYTDPKEEMIGIVMTQRLMDSPAPPGVFLDFWTSAYQAIDD
ncbi:CubicO group peptidase, beta-lactamase class C family [Paenibacillus sp. 1_12]|uniref:serine hydrolase domain-containing protein n=1 Tax=Paenibacillus sp. 1_12 TaxID=1566278 RepID=UPI0008F02FDD|nr:serine hydrolase domain-containing protein [Paenibacillus sp. 1_12]SFL53994.1 CubicO group peptidase, beta-lactamase class C family [Paenibacillus sp. 1_12]